SHASRRSPDARDSRWTSPTGANPSRFPVVVPLDNAHEGEQGGGGADALLLTVTSMARSASFPAPSGARTSKRWRPFVRARESTSQGYGTSCRPSKGHP